MPLYYTPLARITVCVVTLLLVYKQAYYKGDNF